MARYRLKSKLFGFAFGFNNLINGAKGLGLGVNGAGTQFAKGLAGVGLTAAAGYGAYKVGKTYKDAYTGELGNDDRLGGF